MILEPLELPLRALAPAKINLGLLVGPTRPDGRHELVSVMQSISLADELTLEQASVGAVDDELVCPGVDGENLAARALALFREASGWRGEPVRLRVDKRIPVAGGLGGGSADAAAALRLARCASGRGEDRLLLELAGQLGADVPAQVSPGRWLATGAGERLQALASPDPAFGVLVLPIADQLSTAAVYEHADRLGIARSSEELEHHRAAIGAQIGEAQLLVNDLQTPATELCPAIEEGLDAVRQVGADAAFVSGSGPTVIGLFTGTDALRRMAEAETTLAGRRPRPIAASPVGEEFAAVRRLGTSQLSGPWAERKSTI